MRTVSFRGEPEGTYLAMANVAIQDPTVNTSLLVLEGKRESSELETGA
jgi:hypothetical protein